VLVRVEPRTYFLAIGCTFTILIFTRSTVDADARGAAKLAKITKGALRCAGDECLANFAALAALFSLIVLVLHVGAVAAVARGAAKLAKITPRT
jgi:hypothetical protein